MKTIKLDIAFGEKNMVVSKDYTNLEYNSVLELPTNGKVLVLNHSTKERFEPTKLEGGIFNKKPKGLLNAFKKIDPASYTIYVINCSKFSGTFGGNFSYHNEHMDEIQYEKVYFTGEYEFKVSNIRCFVKEMISEEKNQYDVDYFRKKISKKINDVIEEKVSKSVNDLGFEYFSASKSKLKKQIDEAIAGSSLALCGIDLEILSVKIEEDEKHKVMKDDTEERMYQANKANKIKGE